MKPASSKLTDQQRYLLQRIPTTYNLKGYVRPQEPAEVKRARIVIEQWEKSEGKKECEAKKRNEALITKAREAVYFEPPDKALVIVRQCEKLLKGCPV